MDRFAVEVDTEIVSVDTGVIIEGAAAGSAETIDEPRRGEGCATHG
jgi:hypothetical protein